jgi:hypothetical protein
MQHPTAPLRAEAPVLPVGPISAPPDLTERFIQKTEVSQVRHHQNPLVVSAGFPRVRRSDDRQGHDRHAHCGDLRWEALDGVRCGPERAW